MAALEISRKCRSCPRLHDLESTVECHIPLPTLLKTPQQYELGILLEELWFHRRRSTFGEHAGSETSQCYQEALQWLVI